MQVVYEQCARVPSPMGALRHVYLTTALLLALCTSLSAEEPVSGFITPYRTINVATAETGIFKDVLVKKGDRVKAGHVLAQLDDSVHASMLAIARQNMKSDGRLQAAKLEHQIRVRRLNKLQELIPRGSARPEEVDRAEADAAIAAAQLLALQEDMVVKRLDYDRARVQLERRTVRAPARGIVVHVHKEAGEFAGPNDPHVVTIVQLDPLLAVFALPSRQARRLATDKAVRVRLPETNAVVKGKVDKKAEQLSFSISKKKGEPAAAEEQEEAQQVGDPRLPKGVEVLIQELGLERRCARIER